MTVHATNHSANLGPSLRLELELTPPKDSPPELAARDSAATWDCQKNPLGSLPTCIFKMSDFVHRTRSLGKAYAFARRLNEKHERKAAA